MINMENNRLNFLMEDRNKEIESRRQVLEEKKKKEKEELEHQRIKLATENREKDEREFLSEVMRSKRLVNKMEGSVGKKENLADICNLLANFHGKITTYMHTL